MARTLDPPATESALELEREQQVGELAVAVRLAGVVRPRMPVQIVEVDLSACVGVRGDRDDPAGDVRQQQIGQDEVTEMVRADLALEAIGGSPFRDQHDPGVVDEDVDGAGPRGREGSNRCQVLEVQRPDLGIAGIVAAMRSPLAGSRTARTTFAPAAASARALASPMPLEAPVTTTTRPVRSGSAVESSLSFAMVRLRSCYRGAGRMRSHPTGGCERRVRLQRLRSRAGRYGPPCRPVRR